ncbi:hypothetical protein ACFROC_09985 [Nocardia tengchongensis]|uniref:hypothetical protein n=1 Tax=Nocardia tengchongensis TaxID=2055889 RepID=UPI00368F9839
MIDLRTGVLITISLMVAVAAAILTYLSGQPPAAGVLACGGAFAATMLFCDKLIR